MKDDLTGLGSSSDIHAEDYAWIHRKGSQTNELEFQLSTIDVSQR